MGQGGTTAAKSTLEPKVVSIMHKQLQQKKLTSFKDRCLTSIENRVKIEEGYCEPVWDDIMCWDQAPPNTIQSQPCPDYIHGFNTHENATRYCDGNGTWFVHPRYNSSWTNYISCSSKQVTTHPLMHTISPLDIEEAKEHGARLLLISSIGYGVSLFSLIIAVIIMCCSRKLKSKTNTLHLNLFLAFILRACLSFLIRLLFVNGLALEKDLIKMDDGRYIFNEDISHWECRLLQTVFLYAICVSQMWIFVEGLYLHMLIYKTLTTDRNGVRMYTILGWLLPCVIVVPWVIVKYITDNHFCWNLSSEHHYIWIVNGPMLFTVLLNFIFFLNISRVLCSRVRSGERHMGSAYRRLAKFILVLVPLFGVFYILLTLVFPMGYASRFNTLQMYAEMTYNSFQGFILALLFCFLNEEVLTAVKNIWRRRTSKRDSGVTRSFVLSSFRRPSRYSRGASIVTTSTTPPRSTKPLRHSCSSNSGEMIRPGWLLRVKMRVLAFLGRQRQRETQYKHRAKQSSTSSNSSLKTTKGGLDVPIYGIVEEEPYSTCEGQCPYD